MLERPLERRGVETVKLVCFVSRMKLPFFRSGRRGGRGCLFVRERVRGAW